MSRIGQKAVEVPSSVTISVGDGQVSAKGSKGETSVPFPECITVSVEGGKVQVGRLNDTTHARAMHGTVRSLIANLVEGVEKGFERHLVIQGVGYRAQLQGQTLVLNLGYSHDIKFPIPDGVTVTLPDQTNVSVSGIDKQLVGLVSSRIRSFAPAEPYKGKGVRYRDEQIRRKVGKAVS